VDIRVFAGLSAVLFIDLHRAPAHSSRDCNKFIFAYIPFIIHPRYFGRCSPPFISTPTSPRRQCDCRGSRGRATFYFILSFQRRLILTDREEIRIALSPVVGEFSTANYPRFFSRESRARTRTSSASNLSVGRLFAVARSCVIP